MYLATLEFGRELFPTFIERQGRGPLQLMTSSIGKGYTCERGRYDHIWVLKGTYGKVTKLLATEKGLVLFKTAVFDVTFTLPNKSITLIHM